MIVLEETDSLTGKKNYGMSSADGDSTADLPTDAPQGSFAMDYSTLTAYFFDGTSWNS